MSPQVDSEPSQGRDCVLIYYISGIWHGAWLEKFSQVLIAAVNLWLKCVTGWDIEKEMSVLVFFLLCTNGPKDKAISALLSLHLTGRATWGPVLGLLCPRKGLTVAFVFLGPPKCHNCPVWKTTAARLCFWRSGGWYSAAGWQLEP